MFLYGNIKALPQTTLCKNDDAFLPTPVLQQH